MDALDVARLMHRLFSAFDAAVADAGLFKMDTVGDAYVAAGFFPQVSASQQPGNDSEEIAAASAAATTGKACDRVLRVARDMIAAVAACREETGRDVHCRIGVSAGEVLAGVLGRLQPRFHIFGAGLSGAERHEKAGQIDAVHASPTFMAALALAGDIRWGQAGREGELGQQDGFNDSVSSERLWLAAAEALECVRTGSSGHWNLELSEMVELPANSQAAVENSQHISAKMDEPSKDQAPMVSVQGSGPHCGQVEADQQQHSFILRPRVADDEDSDQPGRRFFAATAASVSNPGSLPPPTRRQSAPSLSALPQPRHVGRCLSMGSEGSLSRGGIGLTAVARSETSTGVDRGPAQELPQETMLLVV
jgi:hypothetical protein